MSKPGTVGGVGRQSRKHAVEWDKSAPGEAWAEGPGFVAAGAEDVGAFEQGSPFSRWALARYLVGRAIAESISRTLLVLTLGILALAAVLGWIVHTTFWAVVVGVLALVVLGLRAILRAVLRRLSAADRHRLLEQRLRSLVSDTRADVLAELRRIGLPAHTVTLPLLALRLVGRRRKDTVARLRTFELERVVPPARLDELHMVLRAGLGLSSPRPAAQTAEPTWATGRFRWPERLDG